MAFGENNNNGNELLSNCKAVVNAIDRTSQKIDLAGTYECDGLIRGMIDLNWYYSSRLGDDAFYCMPSGFTVGQGAIIIVKYLNKHPELLNQPDTLLIIKAFMDAYPCK